MAPRDVERWLNEVFEEADGKASENTTFDAGTYFYGIVTREIPTIPLVLPVHLDPRMHPERIPHFYMWVRGYVLEGKI